MEWKMCRSVEYSSTCRRGNKRPGPVFTQRTGMELIQTLKFEAIHMQYFSTNAREMFVNLQPSTCLFITVLAQGKNKYSLIVHQYCNLVETMSDVILPLLRHSLYIPCSLDERR